MLKYTSDHEWVQIDNDFATVGITAFAQERLGDLVFVELPKAGSTLQAGGAAAVVEFGKGGVRCLCSNRRSSDRGQYARCRRSDPDQFRSDRRRLAVQAKGQQPVADREAARRGRLPEPDRKRRPDLIPRSQPERSGQPHYDHRYRAVAAVRSPPYRSVFRRTDGYVANDRRGESCRSARADVARQYPPARSARSGRSALGDAGACARPLCRRAERCDDLADRSRLLWNCATACDPAERPGKSRLVYCLYAIPAGDQSGPLGSAAQLSDRGGRSHRSRNRQRVAARRGHRRRRGNGYGAPHFCHRARGLLCRSRLPSADHRGGADARRGARLGGAARLSYARSRCPRPLRRDLSVSGLLRERA